MGQLTGRSKGFTVNGNQKNLTLGLQTNGNGVVVVKNTGSAITNLNQLNVGVKANASVMISDAGNVQVNNQLLIGGTSLTAKATVDVSQAKLSAGRMTLGTPAGSGGGSATLTVESGGLVQVTSSFAVGTPTFIKQATGILTINGGALAIGPDAPVVAKTLTVGQGGFAQFFGSADSVTAQIQIDGGLLEVMNTGAAGSSNITFGSGAGSIEVASGAGLVNGIAQFATGDKIDLDGVTANGDKFDPVHDVLSILNGTTSVATLQFVGAYNQAAFAVTQLAGFAKVTYNGSPAAGGGTSIFWQNASDGEASIWEMNGSDLVGGGPVSPNPGPGWTEIGTGDFNHDGQSDILWQNASTGQASIWDMNGASLVGGGPVSPNPGPSWKAIGTGDFTDDGFSDDILWQNASTGQVSIWEMNGSDLVGGGPVSPNPGPSWQAIGTGDFNKDGSSDILFQNKSTGQLSIWEMNGASLIGGGPVSPNPGPAWQAIGTGDFTHDGFSDDILLQNKNTGQISVWEMDGTSLIGGGPVSANPGTSWHAIGTGGGGSDILLQNTSGQASIWEMSGNSIVGGGPVSPSPGPSWHAIGLT